MSSNGKKEKLFQWVNFRKICITITLHMIKADMLKQYKSRFAFNGKFTDLKARHSGVESFMDIKAENRGIIQQHSERRILEKECEIQNTTKS